MFKKLKPFAGPLTTTEITDLRIYPIKSCRGVSVPKSYLTRQGLEFDRRWMFVDAQTLKFITIRDISHMTLIDTAFASTPDTNSSFASPLGNNDAENLIISIRHTDRKVMVPARPTQEWLTANSEVKNVNIWDYETDGYVYKDEINEVFTDFFGRQVKLVYKGPTPRILRGNGDPRILGREESTNFPDVMPLQIANEASMQELNARLKEKGHDPITIERFRPNIIVKGSSENGDARLRAWSEDSWKTVRVVNSEPQGGFMGMLGGDRGLEIDVQARCARCQVPNVDPETAVKDKHEPWDTLVSYRRVDEGIKWKPCFGMLSAPRNEGPIAVGMKVEILETTEGHKYIKGF
jgi:uncharacterized protein YcbX